MNAAASDGWIAAGNDPKTSVPPSSECSYFLPESFWSLISQCLFLFLVLVRVPALSFVFYLINESYALKLVSFSGKEALMISFHPHLSPIYLGDFFLFALESSILNCVWESRTFILFVCDCYVSIFES